MLHFLIPGSLDVHLTIIFPVQFLNIFTPLPGVGTDPLPDPWPLLISLFDVSLWSMARFL